RIMPPPAMAIREARMNLRQVSILAASSSMCASMRTISSCGSPSLLWACKVQHSQRTTARLDTLFRRNDDTRMEALMDLADWLRSLGLERYEAVHIEPVSRKPKRKYA